MLHPETSHTIIGRIVINSLISGRFLPQFHAESVNLMHRNPKIKKNVLLHLSYPLRPCTVQSVQALPGIDKVQAFNKDLLFFQPGQGIPHRAGRKIGFPDNILLGHLPVGLQDSIDKFGRRGQVLNIRSIGSLTINGHSKNDHSWLTT
jgi:hypothetical protein